VCGPGAGTHQSLPHRYSRGNRYPTVTVGVTVCGPGAGTHQSLPHRYSRSNRYPTVTVGVTVCGPGAGTHQEARLVGFGAAATLLSCNVNLKSRPRIGREILMHRCRDIDAMQ
jgi:rRNA maturation protein Nop10